MTNEGFDEEALVRALRAPGSPSELADEQTYRAMFRAAHSPGPVVVASAHRRAAVRRLGTGTTLAVVVALATGGVAAAYSSNLPAPVQRAVHSVLSPLGVPAAEPKRPVVEARQSPEPEPEVAVPSAPPAVHPTKSPSATRSHKPAPSVKADPSPTADPSASEAPALPSESPSESPSEGPSESPSDVPSSTESADPSTSPSPSGSPTPTDPPAPVAASVAITSAGAGKKVAPGGTAVVAGRVLAADGTPVPDATVVLQMRGASGWQRVANSRTAADGSVALATGPVQRSTKVRFRTSKVRSAAWKLVVQPSVTASAQTVEKVSTVTAQVTGGQAGDRLVLATNRNGQMVQEGAATLDSSAAVQFQVTAPNRDRWYVVQFPATAGHGAAKVRVLVTAPVADES